MSTSEARPMESPTLGALGAALAKAQGVMQAASKDSTNPHFRSSYADLASIREAIREPLSTNGLSYFQRVSSGPEGVTVETTLLHSSGEFVRDSCWLPVVQQTAQAFGSAITYARRYSLAAIVGVVADEDDDGNAASHGARAPLKAVSGARSAPAPKPQPAPKAGPKPQSDPLRCAADVHEWDPRGVCQRCGAQEAKAVTMDAKPAQQRPDIRARASKLYRAFVGDGKNQDEFKAWAASVIGRDVPSIQWTAEDVAHLEKDLPELLRDNGGQS